MFIFNILQLKMLRNIDNRVLFIFFATEEYKVRLQSWKKMSPTREGLPECHNSSQNLTGLHHDMSKMWRMSY